MVIYVMLAVDWEKDHGIFRSGENEVDYGGILVGTLVLCSVLDSISMPCRGCQEYPKTLKFLRIKRLEAKTQFYEGYCWK